MKHLEAAIKDLKKEKSRDPNGSGEIFIVSNFSGLLVKLIYLDIIDQSMSDSQIGLSYNWMGKYLWGMFWAF